MTPEDKRLSQDILRAVGPLKLYRVARYKYANLSGVGSALYPGRWNRIGQEAIYTSTDPGTPVLEHFAHIPKNEIPSNLAMMEIHLDRGSGFTTVDLGKRASMPPSIVICPTIKSAREAFPQIFGIQDFNVVAMAVPSVITPSWNVVLYPQGRTFWDRVFLHSVEPFEYDERLFPENTPKEISE